MLISHFRRREVLLRILKYLKELIIKLNLGDLDMLPRGKIRGQGNRGAGNLEDGIPIYFERQNTPGNIVQRSAQIVFPTQKAADTFYQKYSLILKRK